MALRSRWSLGALVLGLLAADPGAAQDFRYYNVCGVADGTSLRVCASADLYLTGETLRMRVWNMEIAGSTGAGSYSSTNGGWHTITSLGLQYMGTGTSTGGDFSSARYIFGSGANDYRNLTYWYDATVKRNTLQVELGSSTQGHRDGIVGCVDPGPSNAGHVSTCNSWGFMPYVEFTFTGVDADLAFEQYNFEFHGQQMLNGKSAKGSGSGYDPYPPTEVVPEPITMVLLGTGLAGIGGVNLRRRRRDAAMDPEDGLDV